MLFFGPVSTVGCSLLNFSNSLYALKMNTVIEKCRKKNWLKSTDVVNEFLFDSFVDPLEPLLIAQRLVLFLTLFFSVSGT